VASRGGRTTGGEPVDPDAPPGVRTATRWAAVVVAAEGAVLVGAGVYLAVETVVGQASRRAAAVFLALIALLLGFALGWCARAFAAGRRWPRGPVLTWQLVQAAVAFQTLSGHAAMPMPDAARWAAGLPLLAAAVFVVAVLLRDPG